MELDTHLYSKIAQLEAELKDSLRDRDMMREDLKDIKKSVHEITLVLAERKGGTKYLFVVLTVAAAIGGLIDRLLTWSEILPK